MRFYGIFLVAAALLIPDFGEAQTLEEVCSSTTEIGSNGLWKWKASDHINSADPRAKGPSLICSRSNKRCVEWPAKVFYCNGERAHRGSLLRYGTWAVTGADRGYTRYGNSKKMRKDSRDRECDEIYVQREKSSPSACYSVSIADERSGTPF